MDAALQQPLTAARRGAALLWSLVTVMIVAMLGVAAFYLSAQDRLIGENFERGYRALYVADEGLSTFYAEFRPATDLELPIFVGDFLSDDDEGNDDDAQMEHLDEYDGVDLIPRYFGLTNAEVWVTSFKAIESAFGDVYALESVAVLQDARGRPAASRTIRTMARLVPPIRPMAALLAPGGVQAHLNADHFHLDGGKKGKCGSGTGIKALMAPSGTANLLTNKKVHIKSKTDPAPVDTSLASYSDMLWHMESNWAVLGDDATYSGLSNVIRIPGDYASLSAVPFDTFDKQGLWPIVLMSGDVHVNADVKKGFGLLVITGSLTMTKKVEWAGIILTGKGLTIFGDAHLHASGLVAAGLNCTAAQAANGDCRVYLQNKHLGVAYHQCNVEAAWAQLLVLRPLTPSRHTRLY